MNAQNEIAHDVGSLLVSAALTDTGRVRTENEDAFVNRPDLGLFLVADGMGGHQGGATAAKVVSEMMVELVRRRLDSLRAQDPSTIQDWLHEEILDLSGNVRAETAGRPGLAGMGTTLVMALLLGDQAHIAHMGDSRAYLLRQGQLDQLTEDHSLIAVLIKSGELSPHEAMDHPARGQLTRYIGMETAVYPDVRTVELQPDNRLLLCSDGLTGMVSDRAITEILVAHPNPESACEALIDAANGAGGHDNITALIVHWLGSPGRRSTQLNQ